MNTKKLCRLCLDGLVSLIDKTHKIHGNLPFSYSFQILWERHFLPLK